MTDDAIPLFEYAEVTPPSALRMSVQRMIKTLDAQGRLTADHEPLCALALKLANALEQSGGRGASVALLSAQFREVWATLAALPAPIDESANVEMEIALIPLADAG